MAIMIRATPFDPYAEMRRHEAQTFATPGQFGACASFVGTMRDFNERTTVTRMFLEHYPGMTEQHLAAIGVRAAECWSVMPG